ncbi:hypothetical protein Cadr_000027829 [Camelus dromedarius]|uniref:Uncharacterized protein n=1 Tax=Camelus dromedarius TaxID=9838 RepID=A0A5N4CA53_CAMDR|nr:hypothetical protein Cadr_000027829 [Camelus dromedarius]
MAGPCCWQPEDLGLPTVVPSSSPELSTRRRVAHPGVLSPRQVKADSPTHGEDHEARSTCWEETCQSQHPRSAHSLLALSR